MKMQQFIKINFITNNVITRYLILKKKKIIIFKNKIIFLPTYPFFQNHVIGTTNIFYLGLMGATNGMRDFQNLWKQSSNLMICWALLWNLLPVCGLLLLSNKKPVWNSAVLLGKHDTFLSLHQENMSVKCIPPQTPLLYRKTGVCRGIPIFLIFAPKHRLWVLVRTASVRRF